MELKKSDKIYLAPFNKPSILLEQYLKERGIIIQGFIDSFKSGKNIYKKMRLKDTILS